MDLRHSVLAKRIASGTAANLLGKIWVFIQQIIAIPVLTAHWGAEGYGLWLLISTAPGYILLADFGLAPALAVSLAGAIAQDDIPRATSLLRTASILVVTLTVIFAAVAAAVSLLLAATGAWNATLTAPGDVVVAVVAMSAYAVLIAQMNVINSVYRATYHYVRGTLLADLMIPTETAVLIISVSAGGSVATVALSLLAVRLVGLLLYLRDIAHLEPWARIRPSRPSKAAISELLRPSLASFALTLSGAFSFHGLTLAIGAVAGPAAVASFGAARILTRAPLQFSGLLTRATLPELTRASLNGDVVTSRRLQWLGVGSSAMIMLPFFVIMLVAGPTILSHLSGSDIVVPTLLIGLLAVGATCNALWTAASTPLVAQNQQGLFSYWYVGLCGLSLAATVLIRDWPAPLVAAGAMALGEVAMLGLLVRVSAISNRRAGHVD